MAGQQPLKLFILVRIQVPEPEKSTELILYFSLFVGEDLAEPHSVRCGRSGTEAPSNPSPGA